MTLALMLIFWLSLGVIVYVYACYPLAVWFLSRFKKPFKPLSDETPAVTAIIAAHNEAQHIAARLDNLLSQDYPQQKLQIIVASDGSTDETVSTVREFASSGVEVLELARGGRALAHNAAAERATGEILVFTDAQTQFAPDFLRRIASNFTDPRVGCVTGRLEILHEVGRVIERSVGAYWTFELALRRMESRLGILAIATGACMAVQRGAYRPLAPADDVDFTCPIDCILQGLRVVHDETAAATEWMTRRMGSEFRARVRMAAQNFAGALRKWQVFNAVNTPGAAISLVSHKLLRWLVPYAYLVMLAANLALLEAGWPYQWALIGQGVFWGLAAAGGIAYALGRRLPLASAGFSFVLANAAFVVAVPRAVFGPPIAAYDA